jgi:hypothetical protein
MLHYTRPTPVHVNRGPCYPSALLYKDSRPSQKKLNLFKLRVSVIGVRANEVLLQLPQVKHLLLDADKPTLLKSSSGAATELVNSK